MAIGRFYPNQGDNGTWDFTPDELEAYRDAIIEECAAVCDVRAEIMALKGGNCDPDVLAEQIRALKGKK